MSHVLPSLSLTEHQVIRILAAEDRPLTTGAVRRCCSPFIRPRVAPALRSLARRGIVERVPGSPRAWSASPGWWLQAHADEPRRRFAAQARLTA